MRCRASAVSVVWEKVYVRNATLLDVFVKATTAVDTGDNGIR